MSEADRVEQAYRRHWARLLALLTSELRDLDLAEESLQDAFAAAVSAWPPVPDNPPAWLLTTARRRAFDRLRRTAVAVRKAPLLIVEEPDRHEVPDDLLRLIFTCCHPALAPEARVALTLRCVAGLTTRQIARLFLVGEATMAARITRAKKKISQAGAARLLPAPGRHRRRARAGRDARGHRLARHRRPVRAAGAAHRLGRGPAQPGRRGGRGRGAAGRA